MVYGGIGLLLLTAVAGYWVLERASKHKGDLQKVGYALGSIVIVLSLFGVICQVWHVSSGKGHYGKMKWRGMPHASHGEMPARVAP